MASLAACEALGAFEPPEGLAPFPEALRRSTELLEPFPEALEALPEVLETFPELSPPSAF